MHSPRPSLRQKSVHPLPITAALLLLIAPIAKAQDDPVPPSELEEVTIPLYDAGRYLHLARTRKAFQTPLDLKIENATLEEIVASFQKALAARKLPPLPSIELRDLRPIRLSFTAQNSTVARVLNSAATLAGGRLWLVDDYALLAPELSLLPEEQLQRRQGFASTAGTDEIIFFDTMAKQKTLSTAVVREIEALAAKSGAGPSSPPPATDAHSIPRSGVPFAELSPDAQAMLQELVADAKTTMTNNSDANSAPNQNLFTLSPDSRAWFSSHNNGSLELSLATPGSMIAWTLDGSSLQVNGGVPPSTPTPPAHPTLPLDPSANKS